EEHVRLDDRAVVQGDVVLDLDVVADDDARGDVDVLAEDALHADLAIGHDVREMPDLGPVADVARLIDVGGLVNEVRLIPGAVTPRVERQRLRYRGRTGKAIQYRRTGFPSCPVRPGSLGSLSYGPNSTSHASAQRMTFTHRQTRQSNGRLPSRTARHSRPTAAASRAGTRRNRSGLSTPAIHGPSSRSQRFSGVAKPTLSRRSRIASGTIPRMASRKTCLVTPSAEIRYSSGRLRKCSARAGVKNGTRLSIDQAIEFRSSYRKSIGRLDSVSVR